MGVEYTCDYAILRVVPRVERGERVNVGVILSCVDDESQTSTVDTGRTSDPAATLERLMDTMVRSA